MLHDFLITLLCHDVLGDNATDLVMHIKDIHKLSIGTSSWTPKQTQTYNREAF